MPVIQSGLIKKNELKKVNKYTQRISSNEYYNLIDNTARKRTTSFHFPHLVPVLSHPIPE